ncbi:MAG: hypothetical protein ACE366_18700 [Bradymonadia bacterium]
MKAVRFMVCALALWGCGESSSTDGAQGLVPQSPESETPPDGKADGVPDETPDDFAPLPSTQIDRMGHVEVGPLILKEPDIADRWNQAEPFALDLSETDAKEFEEALRWGLIRYDHYDSYPLSVFDLRLDLLKVLGEQRDQEIPDPEVLDWFDDLEQPHPLTEVYMTDALFVDVSKPCPADGGYLEPELATLVGQPYETCGGRHPNEDVIDVFATVLINGIWERETEDRGDDPYPHRGDTVTEPYAPAKAEFPYLAEPYDGWEDGLF